VPNPPLTPGQKADLTLDDWFDYGWVNGGEFLVEERGNANPRPDLNAYLAHWRQYFGPSNMNQIEARLVYEAQFAYLETEGIISSEYDPDYVDSVDSIEALANELDAGHDLDDLPVPT
jgi:hypothetical protein